MGDARSYDAWAKRLAAGDWLGSDVFYQAPLYPYFLGTIYATFGEGPWAPRIVQCLLGATGCVLLAVAGARLVTRRAGVTAGLMLAVYPPAIFFDGLIQKTTLTSFLVCGLLAVAAGLARRPASITRWLLAGVTTGLLTLVREHALVLAALAPLWIAWAFGRFGRRRFGWIAVFLTGIAAVLLPVAARNRYVGNGWHLTTSQFGPNFYIGNHAGANGLYEPLRFDRGDPLFERVDATELAEEATGYPLSPGEVSRYWTSRTLADIAADPLAWTALLGRKLWYACGEHEIIDTEDQYTYAEHSTLLASLMRVWHMGVLVPLAGFGAVLLLRHKQWRRRFAWPTLIIVGYTVSVLLFFLLGRYRFPLVPPLMLFAAAGLWQAVRLARSPRLACDRRRREQRRRPLLAAAALGLAAVLAVPVNVPSGSIDEAKSVTRTNLGKHLFLAGFPSERVTAEYDRAIELMPRDLLLKTKYARILWEMDQRDAARAQLETAVQQAPHDAAILIESGLMLRELGEFELSTARLRAAVAAAPRTTEPPYHLAINLLDEADRVGRIAAAYGLQATSPFSLEADEARKGRRQAEALRREAAALLRQSLAIDADSDAAHAALADALTALGERDEAAREYAIAATLAPEASNRRPRPRQAPPTPP
ncbi:MAG: glycosyltransferase family 39 protein [Planctomycetaceae bacterium]